jgi:hypothetical protein
MATGESGGKFKLLLGVLVVLMGLGAFNYYRNWKGEEAEQGPRPLASYDDVGLTQLADAYRAEIEVLQRRQDAARGQGNAARGTEFIGEGVREFERVQRSSQRVRGLTGELAEREARLRDIEDELAHRQRIETQGWQLHLARLVGT